MNFSIKRHLHDVLTSGKESEVVLVPVSAYTRHDGTSLNNISFEFKLEMNFKPEF